MNAISAVIVASTSAADAINAADAVDVVSVVNVVIGIKKDVSTIIAFATYHSS